MTGECFTLPTITHDNEQRFSLGGAAHGPLQEDSGVGIRAGERKTYWTEPLPPPPVLWALNGPGSLASARLMCREHRFGAVGRTDHIAKGSAGSESGHWLPLQARWHSTGRGRRRPGLAGGSASHGRMPILGHDVSGTGSQTRSRVMLSTTTMMPVPQCGHSRNDRPVSASKRSR